MNMESLGFRMLRSVYRTVNARLYRRIDHLMSELAKARAEAERASHAALWAREEAKQLQDLMDEKYVLRKNRVGSEIRDDATNAAIHQKLGEMGPWQGPYDFGSGIRAPREAKEHTPDRQRDRFANLVQYQDEDFFRRRATRLFHSIEAYVNPAESTFIDVGCADGYFSIEAAKRGFNEVVGLDVRKENIDRARYAAELFGLKNVRFEVDNVYDLSTIRGRKFDVMVCQGVMYHLAHPILALQKLLSVTGNVAFIAGWTAIGDGAKFDLRTDDVEFFLDGDQEIVAIPTYEGLRQSMRLVGFKNVLEVIRPGLGPTGEWREFLGFAR
jgi:SAM-dependent methyltransferase